MLAGTKCLGLKRKDGAPGESRTPDLLVRSQTLYPAELRAHPRTTSFYIRCDDSQNDEIAATWDNWDNPETSSAIFDSLLPCR